VNRDNPEITPELILEVFAKFQRTSSLNFAIEGDKDKTEIIDLIPDDHGVSPDLAVEQQDTKEALMSCLRDRLSERELEIISLRHGLKGNRPLKLLEVGKIYGLSREGVRKIQTGAERKLNSNSFKNRVRSLLDVS
jgi:RNA polymerase primary sigma factor